jgi:hypothetical protein
MPYSSNTFDDVLLDHTIRLAPESILDVGAGSGKNGKIIHPYSKNIDAIEPTNEYIEKYELSKIYREIYNVDVQTYTKQYSQKRYDVTIFGDVLEHLFRSEVIDIIDYFLYRSKWVIIIWPTNLAQDDAENNSYEIHKNNFNLNDLNKFEVVYYLKNFGGYNFNNPAYTPCNFHYCVLKGCFTQKNLFVYNFANWKS